MTSQNLYNKSYLRFMCNLADMILLEGTFSSHKNGVKVMLWALGACVTYQSEKNEKS